MTPHARHELSAGPHDLVRVASTSACSRSTPRACSCSSSIGWMRRAPTRVVDLHPRSQRTYHYWHAFVPGVTAGQLYAYRVDGPFDPEHGHRFDRDKVLLDPYGKCVARPAGWSRAAACAPGDNCASALEERRRGPESVRLGGRPSAAHALCQDRALRDARGRLHTAPQLRRRGATARHVSRRDREDSVSAGFGNQRRRAAAGVRLRRPGCAGRRERLGVPAGVVLRPPWRVQLETRPARRARRVPGYGEGPAPGRHRGHS